MGMFDKYGAGSIGTDGRLKPSTVPLGKKDTRFTPPTPTPQPMASFPPVRQSTPALVPQMRSVPQSTPTPQGKIFAGSTLSKAMDLLRIPEYAYTGLLKGMREEKSRQDVTAGRASETQWQEFKRVGLKGVPIKDSISRFISGIKAVPSAVENRVSPGQQEGMFNIGKEVGIENPIAQEALNIGTSFAVPATPLGKLAKVVSKVPGVSSITKGIGTLTSKGVELAKSTPSVARAVETVSPYFRRPEVAGMIEDTNTVTQSRLNQLYKTLRESIQGLTPSEQSRVGQLLEGGISENEKLSKIAAPIRELSDSIGKEAVDAGLLDPASYQKYKGQYLSHIFQETLDTAKPFTSRVKQLPGIKGGFFKQRKGAEGYIKQFAPAVFKGLGTEMKDIETAKLFKRIATEYGKPIEVLKDAFDARKVVQRVVPEGMVDAREIISNPKLRKIFENTALPQDIAEYVTRTMEKRPVTAYDKVLGAWKAGKTIYNPAYHVRNVLSNQILSDMSTGRGLVPTVVDYVRSVQNYFGKGEQRFTQAAENIGLIKSVNFNKSLDEFLETAKLVEKSKFQKTFEFPAKFQQVTEETSKLNVFRSWIQKIAKESGRTVNDVLSDQKSLKRAASEAQRAIFSPYNISAKERSLMSRFVPFYSFTRQVVPFTAKIFVENPDRLVKYARAKTAVEDLSSSEGIKEQDRPDYLRSQVRLPVKDKQGKDVYLDPTYVYPFTSTFDTETTGGGLPFGLSPSPFVSEFFQQLLNRDAFFGQDIRSSNIPSENVKASVGHAGRAALPTALVNLLSKVVPAATGKQDYKGRTRSFGQSVLDSLFGIKTSNISPGEIRNKKQQTDVYRLRSIRQEEQKILNDQSLSEVERSKKLQQLRGVFEQESQR